MLDAVFVGALHGGVPGVAWATVIAQVVEAAILVVRQWPEGFGLARAGWREIEALVRIGVPTGVQFVLEVGSFVMLVGLLATFGDTQVAAHQIAMQVIRFAFLPLLAVSEAASVLSGQAVGAGRDELVGVVARRALAVATAYAGACTVLLAFGAGSLPRLFTSDPSLVLVTTHLLWVAAVFQLFDASNVIARGVLQGTGDVRFPALVGIATAWLATPPLTWLLGGRLGLGALGGWIGLCAEIIVGAVILWSRLARGGWRPSAARARASLRADATEPHPVAGGATA